MAFICTIKVVPNSGRSVCLLDKQNQLKCFLKNAPERGKANDELLQLLAKSLKIPQKNVTLIAGHTSKTKIVKIETEHTYEYLLHALGIEKQTSLLSSQE